MNELRFQYGFSQKRGCVVCNRGVKDIMHVLRDCLVANGCWRTVILVQYQSQFFGAADV